MYLWIHVIPYIHSLEQQFYLMKPLFFGATHRSVLELTLVGQRSAVSHIRNLEKTRTAAWVRIRLHTRTRMHMQVRMQPGTTHARTCARTHRWYTHRLSACSHSPSWLYILRCCGAWPLGCRPGKVVGLAIRRFRNIEKPLTSRKEAEPEPNQFGS